MMCRRMVSGLAALAAALGLLGAGCGGGVGSGGTGTADAGVAQGTVSGFGSVIVDGLRFDDRQVVALHEVEPGVDEAAEVRLGDHVELDYGAGGVAVRLRVDATLAGSVASVSAPGRFTVLGQYVVVNTSAVNGPVTQLAGGYLAAADILAGDAVEVHGLLVTQGGQSMIQATRIEKLAALPKYLRVTGVVAALAGTDFSIAGLRVHAGTATVLPAGRTLADGQLVAVLAQPTGASADASGAPQLQADQVRIKEFGGDGVEASVGGQIAALDTVAASFRLGALKVFYAGATLSPPTLALADRQYVRVRGRLRADGALQASSISLRDGRNEAESELKGNILGYDAATQRFQVRGVEVDASRAQIEDCPGGALAEGLFVEVEGALNATMLVAREVHCEAEVAGDTVGRKGTASAVDPATASFVLIPSSGAPVTVRWTATTLFSHTTPQTLAGRRVEVEGMLDAGTLVARKIEAED